ncbi:MAG: stage V sporulation protein AC [Epulopiscium sp.]|nr:stage V sporulation protein AC [Candidatus Epulonipiscium sp.]
MEKIQDKKQQYQQRVEEISPKVNLLASSAKAFFVGGLICTFGQIITNVIKNMGYSSDEAAMITSITLVFIGALLTGVDIYDNIGKYAGAGSLIPITGFANSIVSSAMEFKKEGYIFGLGAKIFTIAGPVLVYGLLASMVVGLYHYLIY